MNIFEQDDYKVALKSLISSKGIEGRGSFKKLAEYLGVHATLVSQILSGSKDFTEEQIFSACEFLGISKLECHYLWILVQIERAGSLKLKNHYEELKDQLRKQALQVTNRVQKNHELTEAEKAIFYSSWVYSAVQLATTLEKSVDFNFICKRFHLSPAKAREVLDFLIGTQLISEKDGIFSSRMIITHLEKNSPFAVTHHTNWRLKAIEAAQNLSDEELIYSVNVSLSKENFIKLREEMVQVIQSFLKVVHDSPAEDIAQFNLDLFWIRPGS